MPKARNDFAVTAGGEQLQLQQERGAVRQQLVVPRPHPRQRVQPPGIPGGVGHAVAEGVERRTDQLREQRLLEGV